MRLPAAELSEGKKNVQGSRYDSATRPHADVWGGKQGAPEKQFIVRRCCQPATGHSNQRIIIGPAPCRSRNLDTAFRSLTTTLSPPLRGQCSWPAPSFPHRRLLRIRSIPGSSAPFGFEAEPGRRQCPETRYPLPPSTLRILPRSLSTPFRVFSTTLRIKAFDRFQTRKLVSPDVRLPLTPRYFLLRVHCGSVLEARFV